MSRPEEEKGGGPEDIGCLKALEYFYAYLDGELTDPVSVAEFEHHVAHCRSCYTRAQLERLLSARIRETAQSKAPTTLRNRLRNLVDKF